jgi:hypothetical protein
MHHEGAQVGRLHEHGLGLTRWDLGLAQNRRGTRQNLRESKGKERLAIGGRLVSQAGSPIGSSKPTVALSLNRVNCQKYQSTAKKDL